MSVERPRICLIVARGRNGVIGADGDLPWRLGSDLKSFKALTSGKPIIMGRKTWESLPRRPLPGRLNIVVTRQADYSAEGASLAGDLSTAFDLAVEQAVRDGASEVFVIGGAQIYAAALDAADRLYLTEVDAAPSGDVGFPEIDPAGWLETGREAFPASERDDHAFVVRVLNRA